MERRAEPDAGRRAIIIGAGAAGLGAAAELRRRGVPALIIDGADRVGESWRRRYDGLRLNSARGISGVRGAPIPWSAGRFPSRDEYADYLSGCIERLGVAVRFGVHATRIDRAPGGYVVHTSAGDLSARSVVVAMGYDRVPRLPDWPGREHFAAEFLHASAYRSAADFAGRDVLVVGTGNSGTEIAAQLAGRAARVRLAMRTPVNIMPRTFLGVPSSVLGVIGRRHPAAVTDLLGRGIQRLSWGDLSRYGMPRPPFGVGSEVLHKGLGPVVDGGFVAALKSGRVGLVGAVDRLDGQDVVLADGTRLQPDAVIAATGYRHGLEDLVGHLGVLDEAGRPLQVDGHPLPEALGLYFNGYWLPLCGQLPAMRISSRRIGREIARDRPAARTGGLRRLENRFYRLIRHRRAADAAVAPAAAVHLDSLGRADHCLVVTYRRDGSPVPTPVWFAHADGAVVFESDSDSAKIARLRRDPRARVAACNSRGRPLGPPIETAARLLSGDEAEAAEAALAERYGRRRRIAQRLRPSVPGHTYVELRRVPTSSCPTL